MVDHNWMHSELRNFRCLKRLALLGKCREVVMHARHPEREREMWLKAGMLAERSLEAQAETYIKQMPGLESIRITGRFHQHPDVTVTWTKKKRAAEAHS